MIHWSVLFVALLSSVFIIGAGSFLLDGLKSLPSWRGIVKIVGVIPFVFGILGFFGSFFVSMGGLDSLDSLEWPIGRATDVLRLSDGTYVVPHEPTNRIQLYDSNLRFVRAWRIAARGGVFKMRVTSDDLIDVHTARGHLHVVYDARGRILSSEPYDSRAYLDSWNAAIGGQTVYIPTAWYLWPLTSPLFGWLCFPLAALLIGLSDRGRGRSKRRDGTEQSLVPELLHCVGTTDEHR